MEWMNENSGLLVVIVGAVLLLFVIVLLLQLWSLNRKIISQRLNFLGMYSKQAENNQTYVKLVIGNRALADFGFTEIGLRCGKSTVNLTNVYRSKQGIPAEMRLSIEQKNAIELSLSEQEMKSYVLPNGKKCTSFSLYIVDTVGKIYMKKMANIKRFAKEIDRENKLAKSI